MSPVKSANATTLDEYRARAVSGTTFTDHGGVFWRYMLSRPFIPAPSDGLDPLVALGLDDVEHRVLSKATSAAGGYLVPASFDTAITSARRARNVIGELARQLETTHGQAIPLPTTTAHGTASWTSENAAVTATDETFSQVTVSAYKASAKTIVSEELVADAEVDLEQYLGDELGQRLAVLEETAYAVGDGTGKPLGVTTTGNGVATVVAATGSATGFKLADVRAAWAALPDAYKPSASWLMSPTALASLANLTTADGALVLPSLHASTPTLYARPVYSSPELPAAAANARSVVVGDLRLGYTVRRVSGLSIARQEEIHSDNGQVGYRLFSRVDGRVVLADALRILVNSAT